MNRQISATGLELIQRFEGLRLAAYRDAVGVWTIGWGHTRTAKPGMVVTRNEAEDLLREDIARFETCVNAMAPTLSQSQFDALVSFAFNVGCGALSRSTLLRKILVGDLAGAANEFGRWNKAGGRVLTGLTRRRAAERELFERYVPPESAGESGQAVDPDGPEIDVPTVRLSTREDSTAAQALARLALMHLGHIKAEEFQASEGLVPDGIIGPVTWRAILDSLYEDEIAP